MKEFNILPQKDADRLYRDLGRRIAAPPRSHEDEVRFYRVMLEELYKSICKAHDRWFASLHARMVYVATAHAVSHDMNQELHGLRVLANDVAHNNIRVTKERYLSATKVLAEGIAYYSSQPVPTSISNIYEGQPTSTLIVPPNRKKITEEMDRCVVIKAESANNGKKWFLTCESEFYLGEYTLVLQDNSFKPKEGRKPEYNFERDFSQLGALIEPFTTLHAFGIVRDDHQEDKYYTQHESLIILEPDLLVEVSTVAKCYLDINKTITAGSQELDLLSHPQWGLMQKFKPTMVNDSLLMGNIANSLLDTWLRDKEANWDKEIKSASENARWDAVKVGEAKLRNMHGQLKDRHIANFNRLPPRKEDERDVIEPTFFSVRYGLYGRLDCLRESHSQPNKKDIYELKSGKPAPVGSKPEHQMQAIGYHLLMRSVTNRKAATTAAVFYSAAENQPVRNVTTSARLEQHFAMTRSLYVAEMLRLAKGDPSIYSKQPGLKEELPWYTDRDLHQLSTQYAAASELEQDYVREYNAFMMRELMHQKVGDQDPRDGKGSAGFSGMWRLTKSEKKETYAIIDALSYRATVPDAPQEVVFGRGEGEGEEYSSFREGDMTLLYPDQEDGKGPLRNQVFKATIVSITAKEVQLRLLNPQVNHDILLSHPQWCIERDIMESSTFNMMMSVTGLLGHDTEKRLTFLGQRPPRFDAAPPIDLTQIAQNFTSSQSEAIRAALSAKDFMLIQGPPGTGKTSRVLAEIVLQLYKNTSEVVFLLAYTNRAVEKLIESIRNLGKSNPPHHIPFLRLTSRQDDPDCLAMQAQGKTIEETEQFVRQTRVFVSTISSYLRQQGNLPEFIPRQTLIIDEASQVLEPHVAGIIPAFDRFILIGDHKQLPPIVLQSESLRRIQSEVLRGAGMENLATSIFERLWRQAEAQAKRGGPDADAWRHSMVMLREHFRMHEDIAHHVNPNYGGLLQLGKRQEQQSPLPATSIDNMLLRLLSTKRVLFYESPPVEGRTNPTEAHRVRKLVQALHTLDPKLAKQPDGIGIITPWRAQISCILGELAPYGLDSITVDTVERFQGSECDNIIVSLATSNEGLISALGAHTYGSGEAEVDRKLNVTLSRAKSRLILLGEPGTLSTNVHYRRLIANIKQQGGFVAAQYSATLFPET